MKASDVPERPILEALAASQGRWMFNFLDGEQSIAPHFPPGTPPKVLIAKMAKLIKRGLVAGCPCWCRGDYEITERGLAWLAGGGSRS